MRRFWFLPLVALAGASVAHATGDAVLLGVHERVVADQVIMLGWANLPADAEEAELELSLDGRHWVRISPQFGEFDRSWSWRVPDVPADRAQLRLRAGDEAREVVVALSREFRIVGSPTATGSSRGPAPEWWRRLAPDDCKGPASVRVDLPALTCAVEHSQAECQSSPSLRAPGSGGRIPLELKSLPPVPDDFPTNLVGPLFVPLRN